MFGRKYDNGLRQVCKTGSVPEAVLENEQVQTEWTKIHDLLKNEEAERKAAAGLAAEAEEATGEQCELEMLRKPPAQHSEGSPTYWKAVANQTVRTYCCFNPEPKTLDGVITWTNSVLQEFRGELGVGCVLTQLDLDLLGESGGPQQQPLLRKRFVPEMTLVKKLIHGSMIGRGGQRKGDECSLPAEGEVVALHTGFDKTFKDLESYFRPTSARKDQALDCEGKELLIVFTDKSIRSRKMRHRGSYTTKSTMGLFSAVPLPTLIPEKAYPDFPGHNTADVFFGVAALQPEELLCGSRLQNSIGVRFSNCP